MSMKSESEFEIFGTYVFLKKLAAGGMAEVFLARPASQAGNGRIQVIKRLLPHVADNSLFLDMFQTEIQVILGFNHPHVVQLHDFGESDQRPYIAMEYLEGKNLKEVILKFQENRKPMPIPMALGLIAQAASGLSYAHTFVNKVTGEPVNAIHRDISPQNLILSYEGNLKVIDFGIAKASSGMVHEPTSVGTIKGKISYLSPEQVNGQAIDARSDVFSLGIVAWELLTLQRPFTKANDTEVSIIGRINNCDEYIVPPSWFNPEIPQEVDDVILKALKKDPCERYASAYEFKSAIRKVMLCYFPHYSYSDTAEIMNTLFQEEINLEQQELRNLNYHAQEAITSNQTFIREEATKPGVITEVFDGLRAATPDSEIINERLIKIEHLMKQKSNHPYLLFFVFYVLSILFVKMDPSFSVKNFFSSSKNLKVSHLTASSLAVPKKTSRR